MKKTKNENKAEKIIKEIWSDIYGRSGGDYFLDCGGEDHRKETQEEIKKSWKEIILKVLK